MHLSARFHAAWGFVLALGGLVQGQCSNPIALGADTTLCAGATLLLDAGPGYQSYAWNTGTTAQTLQVSQPGTYQCTTTDFGTSGDLVVNGSFSQGSTGFSSDYVPGTGGTWGLLSYPGTYAVANSPHTVHSNFASFGDHTSGTGGMLVVNGADIAGQDVWCQTVVVQPNSDYAFSAWLSSAVTSSPAQLVFTVNGNPVGDPLQAPATTGTWLNFYTIWNSGSSTSATICITNLNSSQSGNDFTLDDISFAPFCTYTDAITVTYQDFPEPDLGPDVTACSGSDVVLDATWTGADSYAWQDGSDGPVLAPSVSGTYWVDVTENGCTARDSAVVTFTVQPDVDLGPDQERCEGETDQLDAYFPNASYLWQDGSSGSTFTVDGTGSFTVSLDVAGCTAADTVNYLFHPLPIVNLGADTTLCADTTLFLDISRPGGSYLWNDGSWTPTRALLPGMSYWVDVTELGCTTRDSIDIGIIHLPVVDLGPDFLLCKGLEHELIAAGPGYHYLWSTDSEEDRITVNEADLFWVMVSNVCGMASDSIEIDLDQCDCPVFVPNTFTPNDDGRNDGFRPVFDCPFDSYHLEIFNRWGELIWESTDALLAWDGAGSSPDGTETGLYAWRLSIRPQTLEDRTLRELKGHVALLR